MVTRDGIENPGGSHGSLRISIFLPDGRLKHQNTSANEQKPQEVKRIGLGHVGNLLQLTTFAV
jgi:hypothetical protein